MEYIARNATRGTILADHVTLAESLFARARGLLGTRTLPHRKALLLRPCRQVHSFFMRYPLDLVFVNDHDRVVMTRARFPANRISPLVLAARAVLELPAGTLAETPAEPGDVLHIEPREVSAAGGG